MMLVLLTARWDLFVVWANGRLLNMPLLGILSAHLIDYTAQISDAEIALCGPLNWL